MGLEPITYGLRVRYSTIELNTRKHREDEIRTHGDQVKVGCLTAWLHP